MSKPSRFGDTTDVPVERTRAELDQLLSKHGATQRMTYEDEETCVAVIQFRMAERMVRLEVKTATASSFTPKSWFGVPGCTDENKNRDANRRAWLEKRAAQAKRAAWRRLLLVCRAKLEIITDGGSTLEREFLADVLLPDGRTVHQALSGQLADSYASGAMPPLLAAPAVPR